MSAPCPGGLALCGHPCGCEGRNPSHHPIDAGRWRRPAFIEPPPIPDDEEDDE